MGVFGMIRKAKARSVATSRGLDEKDFEKYWGEREKSLGRTELGEMRRQEERRIQAKYTRGDRFKKAVRTGVKKYRGKKKANKRVFGQSPQTGLNYNSSDIRVNKKLW